jgi:predicted nucleic acid-binding protein
MSAEFADTNVVLYLLDDGPKADYAEVILGQGPRISVQVLNETLVNWTCTGFVPVRCSC